MSKLYATVITFIAVLGWLTVEAYYTSNGHIDLNTLEFKKVYLSGMFSDEPIGIIALKNYTIVLLVWWVTDWVLCTFKNDTFAHDINNTIRVVILTFLITGTIFEAVYRANMWSIL